MPAALLAANSHVQLSGWRAGERKLSLSAGSCARLSRPGGEERHFLGLPVGGQEGPAGGPARWCNTSGRVYRVLEGPEASLLGIAAKAPGSTQDPRHAAHLSPPPSWPEAFPLGDGEGGGRLGEGPSLGPPLRGPQPAGRRGRASKRPAATPRRRHPFPPPGLSPRFPIRARPRRGHGQIRSAEARGCEEQLAAAI